MSVWAGPDEARIMALMFHGQGRAQVDEALVHFAGNGRAMGAGRPVGRQQFAFGLISLSEIQR